MRQIGLTMAMIHDLRVLEREVPKEHTEQLATMMKMFHRTIPERIEFLDEIIDSLRELEAIKHGKNA